MSAHTPGPWETLENPPLLRLGDCIVGQQVWGGDGRGRVALCERQVVGAEQEQANARLIAAAPDLLEVCKSIENDAGIIPDTIWQMRNAAIAKAEGRSL